MNSKEFGLIIEDLVKKLRVSYIDAVLQYCQDNDIDPSTVNPMINKNLKDKIKTEAINLRLVKDAKRGTLPV